MDLHPLEDVQDYLDRYGADLSRFRNFLDDGVQDAAAVWEDKIAQFRDMDPCSRASHIRTFVSAGWRPAEGEDVLSLDVRFNNGLHLYAPDGRRIRVKTRPRNPINGLPLPASHWGGTQEDLFGNEVSPAPYELVILWSIDFGTSTLGTATLAAVDFGLDDNGPVSIYAEEEIPVLSASEGNREKADDQAEKPRSSASDPMDDFNEYLGDQEEDFGSGPA